MDRDRNDRGPGLERPWTGKMVNLTPDWTVSLGNRVATFLGKGCQLCLLSVLFVAASLYMPISPLEVENLMWI